ncbi:hypothetical protein D3C86_2178060 [compost metagenome]
MEPSLLAVTTEMFVIGWFSRGFRNRMLPAGATSHATELPSATCAISSSAENSTCTEERNVPTMRVMS